MVFPFRIILADHSLMATVMRRHIFYLIWLSTEVISNNNRQSTFTGKKNELCLLLCSTCILYIYTGVLISSYPDQEGNKLQRQKISSFIYPIYNHNWRNIITIYIYIYNKTSIKRNILTIKQNTSGSRYG
jgi:hypothetical protein